MTEVELKYPVFLLDALEHLLMMKELLISRITQKDLIPSFKQTEALICIIDNIGQLFKNFGVSVADSNDLYKNALNNIRGKNDE